MEVVQNYLKYPIDKGVYKGKKVVVKKGPYGLYAEIDDSKIKVTSEDIKLEDIIKLLNTKNSNVINEWKGLKILKGPYGPIRKGRKISYPKSTDPKTLKKDCEDLIKNYKPYTKIQQEK